MISSSIGSCDQLLDLLSYQNFDLSIGYLQIKIRTNDFRNVVLLVVDPSSIHHYIFWSDQCYHLVHIVVEFHLYRNLDDLLLSPSTSFYLLQDLVGQ